MRWNKSNSQIGDDKAYVSRIPKNIHIVAPLTVTILICTCVLMVVFYRFMANRKIEKALVVISKDCLLPYASRPSTNDVISSLNAIDRSRLFLRYSDQCSNVVSVVYRGKGKTYEFHKTGAVYCTFHESIDTNGLVPFDSVLRGK